MAGDEVRTQKTQIFQILHGAKPMFLLAVPHFLLRFREMEVDQNIPLPGEVGTPP